jgi:hypothetical protein
MNKDDLKLTYVLKIGYNTRGEGLYEFVFSEDPSSIDTDALGWGEVPASANAQPPSMKDTAMVLSLKTKKIDFKCLHEMDNRAYEDGYFTIHCLAYENQDEDANHDILYEEMPLVVFHYGDTAAKVKDIFMSRDITLKEIDIADSQVSEVEEETETIEEEEEEDDFKF